MKDIIGKINSLTYIGIILMNLFALNVNVFIKTIKYGMNSGDILMLLLPVFTVSFVLFTAIKLQSYLRHMEESKNLRNRFNEQEIINMRLSAEIDRLNREIDRINSINRIKEKQIIETLQKKENKEEKIKKRIVRNALEEIEI